MKKGELSRQRLVDATAALLQRQGFHATGMADVVAESGGPRGSLYFYFPGGKEELACAALSSAGTRLRERLEEALAAARSGPEVVEVTLRVLAEDLVASDYARGSPLATVALEASSTSEPVRRTIAEHYDGWRQVIAERLVAVGGPTEAAWTWATFVLSVIEGALLLAKVERSPRPLHQARELLGAVVAPHLSRTPARPAASMKAHGPRPARAARAHPSAPPSRAQSLKVKHPSPAGRRKAVKRG